MEATIRLFRGVPIPFRGATGDMEYTHESTIKHGFILSPDVIANRYDLPIVIESAIKILSIKNINNAFHKSWEKVKTASIEQLVAEQIMHYITTYGFKSLGVYSDEGVYIPTEKLEVPEFEGLNLIVIKGFTKDELKEKLLTLVNSGIALKEETIKDVLDVALFVELTEVEIRQIKNKEVKTAMYEYLGVLPENPVEFLRLVIYKVTGKTLIIKSDELIGELKEVKTLNINKMFIDYDKAYGIRRLAEIFYRFKPLFLALRVNSGLKIAVNKIRRLAKTNHKPLPEDYLNMVTSHIKKDTLNLDTLRSALSSANVFRKIRLAYALKYREKSPKSILYRIRSGAGYADTFSFKGDVSKALDIVLESIADGLNVKGKKIYIPDSIHYTLPATEKQFTGNFPSGSYVDIPSDMVFGIHWDDIGERTIDLDLSLISVDEKIGWDAGYRNEGRTILFSGDMTSAAKPNGASELFYVQKQKKAAFIMMVNYYNYDSDTPVPFSIMVAHEKVSNLKNNYMIDPNNLVAVANSIIDKKQRVLGLIVVDENGSRFYFAEADLGRSITSSGNGFVEHARNYLFDFYENTIGLKEVFEMAGAEFVEKEEAEIDLSPEALNKTSILKLLL